MSEVSNSADDLRNWWIYTANAEVESITAKMEEYGGSGRAIDLVDIGRDILLASGVEAKRITEEWAAEIGVYFYARGKLSRWTAAVIEGRRVSDDTLYDLGVYVRMAQRIRHSGGWPV